MDVGPILEAENLAHPLRPIIQEHKENSAIANLKKVVSAKYAEIQDQCGFHYQDFIKSVEALLQVQKELVVLKAGMSEFNTTLQQEGKTILSSSEQLLNARRMQLNMAETREIMQQCLQMVTLIQSLNKHIEDKNFYRAQKVLERIKTVFLPQLSKYTFAQEFERTQIPAIEAQIKSSLLSEYRVWLTNIWNHSYQIGSFAIGQKSAMLHKQTELLKRQQQEAALFRDQLQGALDCAPIQDGCGELLRNSGMSSSSARLGVSTRRKSHAVLTATGGGGGPSPLGHSSHEAKPRPANPFMNDPGTQGKSNPQEGVFDAVKLDFAPLYQCLYVYTNMNCLQDFVAEFLQNRKAHHEKLFTVTKPLSDLEARKQYLHTIAGYFIVDQAIVHTTTNLLSPVMIEQDWRLSLAQIKVALYELVSSSQSSQVFMEVKDMVILFSFTMRAYGYDMGQIFEFLEKIATSYCDLLCDECGTQFYKLLSTETWKRFTYPASPSLWELEMLTELDTEFKPNTQAPYSNLVMNFFNLMKSFLDDCFKYSQNLSEMDNLLAHAVDKAIESCCLQIQLFMSSLVRENNLPGAVQLTIDIQYLKNCGPLVGNMFGDKSEMGWIPTVDENQLLKKTATECIIRMSDINENTVSNLFVSFAPDYNWTLASLTKSEPHPFVNNLHMCMLSVNTAIKDLPPLLVIDVLNRLFKAIANKMMDMLCNKTIGKYTFPSIQAFSVDVIHVEQMVCDFPLHPPQGWVAPDRTKFFAELRQMLDLILSPNVEEFMDTKVRESRYFLLTDYGKLSSVLSRIRDTSLFIKDKKMKGVANLLKWLSTRASSRS
ncbi:exocyst complex component 6 [Pelomyxa schiedti]|nr:exocyst complex component 6 [Pelomyxa schiedti]